MSIVGRLRAQYNRDRAAHPEWRDGQTWFNALLLVDAPTAERIRTTKSGPYYTDARIPAFLERVRELTEAP